MFTNWYRQSQLNIKHTMTGRGIVSGSPSLLSGMPKRAPVVTGVVGVGQSVQSSPLLVLRLNTWRILIGDLRLFLPLLVRPAVFFESVLQSPVFLLLLWRVTSLSIYYIYHLKFVCTQPIWSLFFKKWPNNSQSKAQKDLLRYLKCVICESLKVILIPC
jgi:hypothetical protein